ncbi:MAG: hypothetical protein FWB79_04490, partial [Treponema sp.]|nr:hypothetical protein [Treponema sp.]
MKKTIVLAWIPLVLGLVLIGCPGGQDLTPPEPLAAPEIELEGSVVSWDAVSGAGGYSVRIAGDEVEGGALGSDVTSFNLAPLNLSVGDHVVTVLALGVTGQSLDSAPSLPRTLSLVSSSTNIAWTGFTNPMATGVSVEVDTNRPVLKSTRELIVANPCDKIKPHPEPAAPAPVS